MNRKYFLIAAFAAAMALPAKSEASTGGPIIGGRVFCDANTNSMDDSEPGVAGVTVQIVRVEFGVETEFTVTTGVDGSWSFDMTDHGGTFTISIPDGQTALADGTLTTDATVSFVRGVDDVPNLSFGFSGVCEPTGCAVESSIKSEFNGTGIRAGNFLWFNAHVNVGNRPADAPVTVYFENVTITSPAFTLALPDGRIDFSPTATVATTSFDGTKWVTTVPASRKGNVFLTGFAWKLPSDLPGGTKSVKFDGTFRSETPGLNYSWQWSAAAYFDLGGPDSLGVKPVDGSGSSYTNSDHAGTPEAFKSFVTGGARGGGGSNYTGSWSATASATCK